MRERLIFMHCELWQLLTIMIIESFLPIYAQFHAFNLETSGEIQKSTLYNANSP